ncbi:hypothetical protein OS493_023976 [Desmophyllum pertusum]|uniref:PH domain-containing protein n=1 Tax=Desmophyllum pertusum TaxID=174260 RepID=A0A9W9ZZG6_9CNID|nr:hypothetical protein OS493_023976 [Desmophyllum pertusum]
MAAGKDGEKLCEVTGYVKWTSISDFTREYCYGSIALYKTSDRYYIHARTPIPRAKFPLKPDKFQVLSRESRLTISITTDTTEDSAFIHLQKADPNQLQRFLDSLNTVKAYHASLRGQSTIQSMEFQDQQPSSNSNPGVSGAANYELSLSEGDVSTSSPSQNTPK